MIHSLRYVEPVSSFRSTFAYTNITHMLAGAHRRPRRPAPQLADLVTRRDLSTRSA